MDDDVEAKADRSVLMAGLAFVGGLAVIGMLISALAGGSGIGGLLLGAGLGILVSVGVFAGYAFSKM
ncbi:MAG: hypothetical protein AB7G65_16615 [Thermoleophilia bacterium]